ncbi:MAG TPA: transaldolase [Vicinamibacteria bacterium]|nr:transaldolase [Vicinamibacteria bacterium]
MSSNPLLGLKALGQSVWLDSIRRGHILSGELARLVGEDGISGETSNPAIFEKAIAGSPDYDEAIAERIAEGRSALDIYEDLAVEDIRMAADIFRPVYDASDGADGFVSLEVSPRLAYDTAGTTAEAKRLWDRVDRPNLMIKIPGTPEGLPAVEECLVAGINVNVTLLFAVQVYEQVAWTYVRALERRLSKGQPVRSLASVASFFVSRIDTLADAWIDEAIQRGGSSARAGGLLPLKGRAAVANAKLAYQSFLSIFSTTPFRAAARSGARVQRPLWASTSTKNPSYSDVLYVDALIGPDTVNTLPFETIAAFRDHGTPRRTLEEGIADARRALERLEAEGISLKAVTDQVLREGVQKFAEPFEKLLNAIEAKRAVLAHGQRKAAS